MNEVDIWVLRFLSDLRGNFFSIRIDVAKYHGGPSRCPASSKCSTEARGTSCDEDGFTLDIAGVVAEVHYELISGTETPGRERSEQTVNKSYQSELAV